MRFIQSIPLTLMAVLIAIFSIPAIAWASFQHFYPSDPDLVYSSHGKLKMEWVKFAEAEDFTEYLARKHSSDEEAATVEILALRSYSQPQVDFRDHAKIVYSSVVLHQIINCRNGVVTIQDMMMFSQPYSKGVMVKDFYDLDSNIGPAVPGSIDGMKVSTLCDLAS